ncbi:MAG TPA: transcriptional regulator, partial [Oscillibacter sp.]|nr:transcriptional regulator [Oscillibacter sp.]
MNDKKLRALLTAVQCGSFGKATAQLGYTQSAMTHMVNRLEAELGC